MEIRTTSCGSAVRVKPKVRLCEPWVMVDQVAEPRSGDRDFVTLAMLIIAEPVAPSEAVGKRVFSVPLCDLCVSVVKLL